MAEAEGLLLHGVLQVTVFEIDRLSDNGCWNFFPKVKKNKEKKGSSGNLYVTVDLGNARVGRTRLVELKERNPRWFESMNIYCAHNASAVIFSIKEGLPIGSKVIGRASMATDELITGENIEKWLPIFNSKHKSRHGGSKLHVNMQFFHVSKDDSWSRGIPSLDFEGVPFTFFRQRNGCKVTLYQDAHVPNEFTPRISLDGNKTYEPNRCWEDVFDAISNAKHLIYVVGWSVYTKIALIRDVSRGKPGRDVTLGELLVKKAKEGVRVLMLVWDDKTSVKLLKEDGVMATHDEDTAKYFHNSGVHCVLCPRNPDNGKSLVQGMQISTMFTHHQKTIVVDKVSSASHEISSDKRRIMSFIGGIDLCDGRYDTPCHSIFRTLGSTHQNDYHQPCFSAATIKKGGPREPWHDVHCRLEGPIAWDVLINFEQRWRKQSEGKKDLLVKVEELAEIFTSPSPVSSVKDPETWNVQLFRSIDGGSATGFPSDPQEAAKAGLINSENSTVERSIQDAYIHAIRRAKRFIYIENQYFIGSSHSWKNQNGNVGALNLIPKELSMKIVSKILAGERFAVYIVIPMWPEGVPESGSVQAILNWQRKTMEMMYRDVAEAIKAKNIEADPRDYLAFFCLGNKEKKMEREYEAPEKPQHDTDYNRAQKARRFMIYVHAKTMIVDDEYIIIGSANINQRSMDGGRDTEIAMGAYQPHHLASNQLARGQIHGFRMALWLEHLSRVDDSFLEPDSLECIRKVNHIGDTYRQLYFSEETEDLPGHLLSYPIEVTNTGEVTSLAGVEFFPDSKARVCGSKSDLLPPILTT